MSSADRGGRTSAILIGVLAVTQVIGWGTSYDLLAVLGRPVAQDLGMSNETVFAGLSVMMVVGALLGPMVGGRLSRRGAASTLAEGSGLFCVGLVALSMAQGPVGWLGAWVIIGAAGAFGLMVATNTAVVERRGRAARRTIGTLMIFTGLSSAIAWPILAASLAAFGWRTTALLAAGLHLVICLPAHLFALPPRRPVAMEAAAETIATRRPPAGKGTFLAIAGISTAFTFVAFGVSPSLLEVLRQGGASAELALELGSLRSVFGVTARLADLVLGARSSPLTTAMVAAATCIAGLGLLVAANGSVALLGGFVALYGFGTGVATVARVLLPLQFFAAVDFGRLSSRLTLPQNLANATAPVVFTAVLDRGGPHAVAGLAAAALAVALAVCVGLALYRRERSPAPETGLALAAIPPDLATIPAGTEKSAPARQPVSRG